jgi:hypothetical protein
MCFYKTKFVNLSSIKTLKIYSIIKSITFLIHFELIKIY